MRYCLFELYEGSFYFDIINPVSLTVTNIMFSREGRIQVNCEHMEEYFGSLTQRYLNAWEKGRK